MATAERLIRHEFIDPPEKWTDDALMALSADGVKVELVAGEPQVTQSTFVHGILAARVSAMLTVYVMNHGDSGFVCDSSTAFWMKNGNTRAPDVSLTLKTRFKGKPLPKKYMKGAPDLVIEILSPNDTLIGLALKMREYFESGARLAWVINPEDRTVLVYYSAQPDRLLKIGDALDGENLVPGFSLPIADLFAGITTKQKSPRKKTKTQKKTARKM